MSASSHSQRAICQTAAVSSAEQLCLASLSWSGQKLSLLPSRTAYFVLASDDQDGVQALARDLLDFIDQTGIGSILVRRGPGKGPSPVSFRSFKIETILQLLPIDCVGVHVQKVSSWSRKADWLLPLPRGGIDKRARDLQQEAILTAAFGIACKLTSAERFASIQNEARAQGNAGRHSLGA